MAEETEVPEEQLAPTMTELSGTPWTKVSLHLKGDTISEEEMESAFYHELEGGADELDAEEKLIIYDLMGGLSILTGKGKLPVRFKNAFYRIKQRDPQPETMALLGNLLSGKSVRPYYARLTPLLDWRPTNYGDRDSCLMGHPTLDRYVLTAFNTHALLIRRRNTDGAVGAAIGRSWVIPVDGGNLLMRNWYGVHEETQLDILRALLDHPLPKRKSEIRVYCPVPRPGYDPVIHRSLGPDFLYSAYKNEGQVYLTWQNPQPEVAAQVDRRDAKPCYCLLQEVYYARPSEVNRPTEDDRCEWCYVRHEDERVRKELFANIHGYSR